MIILLTVLLFSAAFGLSVFLERRYWAAPNAVIDRVLDRTQPAAAVRPQALSWNLIPRLIGQKVGKGRGAEQIRRDFIQAGIRSPHAEAIFNGLKFIAAIVVSILLTTIMIVRGYDAGSAGFGAIAGLGLGFILPGKILKIRIKRRKKRIERALPNALDLLTIGVEAGLGLDQGIVHVAEQLALAYPDISAEFSMINFETRAGKRRADALRGMAERTGVSDVKKLAAVMIQADRFGTSIAQSLRAHSEHLRIQAGQRAEEKAAKLGVKMVFPIFFFILPSLFVTTVGPMIVRLFKDLLPMMNGL